MRPIHKATWPARAFFLLTGDPPVDNLYTIWLSGRRLSGQCIAQRACGADWRTGFFYADDPAADGNIDSCAGRERRCEVKNENEMPGQRWSGV
jgi:hypothetical protein